MSGNVLDFPASRALASKPSKRSRQSRPPRTMTPAECAAKGDYPPDWSGEDQYMFEHLLTKNSPAEAWAAIYVRRWINRDIPGEAYQDRLLRQSREGTWLLMSRIVKPMPRRRRKE